MFKTIATKKPIDSERLISEITSILSDLYVKPFISIIFKQYEKTALLRIFFSPLLFILQSSTIIFLLVKYLHMSYQHLLF